MKIVINLLNTVKALYFKTHKIVFMIRRESHLPCDPSHQEVQTALDLSAVYETVDVESINSLSGRTSCAVAS